MENMALGIPGQYKIRLTGQKRWEDEILVALSRRSCILKGHSSDLALSIYLKKSHGQTFLQDE